MDKRHFIDEAVFDIAFGSEQVAHEQEAGLATFIQHRLLPLADEVFAELSASGLVCRMDLLEVDLGDIVDSDFCEEMEVRFKTKLKVALLDKVQSIRNAPAPGEIVLNTRQVECRQLEFFLEKGHLPRNAGTMNGEASELTLCRAMQNGGKELLDFLRNTAQRDVVLRRLSKQFSALSLDELMRLLAPSHAEVLRAMLEKLPSLLGNNFHGLTENDCKAMLREHLFKQYLSSSNVSIEPERLFMDIIRMLFPQASSNTQMPNGETRGIPTTAAMDEAADKMDSARLRMAKLEAALTAGKAEKLGESWEALLRDYAELLREIFYRRMGDEVARNKLVQGFPESMLLDLLRILVPGESRFIQVLMQQPELTARADGRVKVKNFLLWQHTLGYLHTVREFDRRDYALSLIRQLSQQGMEQADVLFALSCTDPVLGRVLSTILRQDTLATAHTVTPSIDQLRQNHLLHISAQRREADMAHEIEALDNDPTALAQLLQYLQQLAASEIAVMVSACSLGEVRQLSLSFIALNNKSTMLSAITARAANVQNPRHFYQHILEKLILKQNVDLEQAAQMGEFARTGSTQADLLQASNDVADDASTTEQNLQSDQLLRARLEQALVTGQAAVIAEDWEMLRQYHAIMLRQVFMLRMGEAQAREKLAQGFPAAMLGELLTSLLPEADHFFAVLLKQPEMQEDGSEIAHSRNLALWKYTLSYLHGIGLNGYEKTAYVRGLIRHLDEAGISPQAIRQALFRTDLTLEKRLRVPAEKTTPAVERSQALYQQLLQRLGGGNRSKVMLLEFLELAEDYPDTLDRLYEKIQSGEVELDLSALTQPELTHHIGIYIAHSHGSMGEDFLHEIQFHASKAQDEQRYYQRILAQLLRKQIIDIEDATGKSPGEATGKQADAEDGLNNVELFRAVIENALLPGNVSVLSKIWESLLANHAPLIPQIFARHMGDARLRAKLVQGIPQPMLIDLIRLFVPTQSAFIETLLNHAILPAGSTETSEKHARRSLREQTLAYLHATAANRFVRADYVRSLLSDMVKRGMECSVLRENICRADPSLPNDLDDVPASVHKVPANTPDRLEAHAVAELSRRLAMRLGGDTAGGEMVREIEALASNYPKTLQHLLRHLQVGEFAAEARFLAGQDIDLEQASVAPGEDDAVRTQYLRTVLESALRQGDTAQLSAGIWQEIRQHHAPLVRQLFRQHMGAASAQNKLAQTLPQAMLQQLVALLVPNESGFIAALAEQLQAVGAVKTLWQYTLAYLHRVSQFERLDYARGLLRQWHRQGGTQVVLLRALSRADAALGKALSVPSPVSEAHRAEQLAQQLVRKLAGDSAEHETAAAIEELVNVYPAKLQHLLRQLQAGKIAAELHGLSATEARLLVSFIIKQNTKGNPTRFLAAITGAKRAALLPTHSGQTARRARHRPRASQRSPRRR